ncbi:MAG: hypothetical protein IJI66_07610 [Erysipelotrichaceae bacterium]|nr:hypothetical protein [Erysipelotrichaceae bacterium]
MANTIINKQKYLVHSRVYTVTEIKKYHLNVPAYIPVNADMFFGSEGYDKYLRNGHGVEDGYTDDDNNADNKVINKGYAGTGYVADEHGVASSLDMILQQIDESEGNISDDWIRSPYTISSLGKLDTPELKQQMSDIMRESFSKPGNIVWYPIISLENYQIAKDMELFKDEDYEAVINEALPRWFRSVHLNPDNILWTADYHNNTDNPHIHLIFLEKHQTRVKGSFSLKDLNNLKEQFYSSAMKRSRYIHEAENNIESSFNKNPELKRLHEQMDTKNKQMRNTVDVFLSEKMDAKIDQDIYRLYKKIDKETMGLGKLSYGSKNMEPFRKQIDKIVNEILEHPANKDLYEDVRKQWKDLDQITKGESVEEPDRYQTNEDRKLRISIANKILQGKKDLDRVFDQTSYDGNGIDYDQMKKTELKGVRKQYVLSRQYFISPDYYDEGNGFQIDFKDRTLMGRYQFVFKDSGIEDRYELKQLGDKGIHIEYKTDDVSKRNYNNHLFEDFNKAILNNLQDHPNDMKAIKDQIRSIVSSEDESAYQKAMIDYIASNRQQPDNDYFFDRKQKDFYHSYIAVSAHRQLNSSDFSAYPSNNIPNSFMVLNGLNVLLHQRVSNTLAAQRIHKEAEQYWERQKYLDHQQQIKLQREKELQQQKELEEEMHYGISM